MPSSIKGVAFPFRFSGKGGILTSSADDANNSHIKESIQQIIRTQPTERVMEPDFGCDTMSIIFEPLDGDATILNIAKFNVTKALKQWERRITVNSVDVSSDATSATIFITVNYTIIQTQTTDSTTVGIPSGATA